MFMFAAITIQRMNSRLYTMKTAGRDGLGLSTRCRHVHNKQKHPGKKPQTHIFQYIICNHIR